LDALRREIPPDVAANNRIDEIQRIFDEAITVLRDVSHILPHSNVDRTGLAAALDRLVGRFRKQCACTIRLMVDSHTHPRFEAQRAMYRIAECALDNAVRHAGASLIEVLFRPTARGPELEVRDDGKGFEKEPADTRPNGLGLMLMEHAAARADLQFSIITASGAGTIVRILDPV
jgi:signal transduction histidine kinase